MKNDKNSPIYDIKVNRVIKLLKEGQTREVIAKNMGYSTYKSLDMYLRRKNFYWDSKIKNYVPNINKSKSTRSNNIKSSSKIEEIISLFKKELDAKFIAKTIGFSNHIELASYMSNNGYQWSIDKKNYVKSSKDKTIFTPIPCPKHKNIPKHIIPSISCSMSIEIKSPLDEMIRNFSNEHNISEENIFTTALIEFFKKYGYEKEIEEFID